MGYWGFDNRRLIVHETRPSRRTCKWDPSKVVLRRGVYCPDCYIWEDGVLRVGRHIALGQKEPLRVVDL